MKTCNESMSILSEVMQPSHANPSGTVHGGEIMKIMDTCGGVVAKRHSKKSTVTVRVDELIFNEPIYVGELVICEAQLVFTGNTSMEVKVTVKAENLKKNEPARVALFGLFTYVALDEKGTPCTVQRMHLRNEAEQLAFHDGERRYLERKNRDS